MYREYDSDAASDRELEALDRAQRSLMHRVVKRGRLIAIFLVIALVTWSSWPLWVAGILAIGMVARARGAFSPGGRHGRSCFHHPRED